MAEQDGKHGAPVDRWLAFAFGVIFVSVLLYVATVVENPSALAIRVYVTVLALAAAGIGAILPGFLEIKYKNIVRAGGALGLGVLVYVNEPAIGTIVPKFTEPRSQAQPVADAFLAAIDSGDPARSWALLSDQARHKVNDSESQWNELYKNNIAPLGAQESRIPTFKDRVESPQGAPPGIYRIFTYKSKRAAESGARLETVILRANSSGNWEVYSYQISPNTISVHPDARTRLGA